MSNSIAVLITERIPRAHSSALEVAGKLSEEQLMWRPDLHAPSIGFHLWHVARWADRLQARVPGMARDLLEQLGPGREIWESEQLPQKWGLTPEVLGFGATGMEMGDEMSASLRFPSKADLLDYVQRAFASADRAVNVVEDQHLPLTCVGLYDTETTIGVAVMNHVTHVNRHLGMMEALSGVQGLTGTATR